MQGQSREEANSGLDEAQRAREQLALESMRSLTESLRRMKSAEDRAEYSKIERIRGAVAGKAGASPAAQAAVIRLNEEAEAANLNLNVLHQALSNCQELVQEGCGDLGTQALIKFYEQ